LIVTINQTQERMGVYTLGSLIVACLLVLFGVDVYFVVAFTIWCVSLFYALSDFRHRLLYSAFLVSFFVFLLSGHFVYEIFGYEISYYFGYEYYRLSNILIALSLLSILISHRFADGLMTVRFSSIDRNQYLGLCEFAISDHTRNIRRASKIVFYSTFPFLAFVEVIQKFAFVRDSGYASYYVDFTPNTPFVVRALANMAPYAFLIILATMPRKSECRIPLFLYSAYAVASLLTGRRIYFVLTALLLMMYFILRNILSVYNDCWINKKLVILAMLAVPFLLMFLFEYKYARFGRVSGTQSFIDQVLGFFQQQGFSASVIRLTDYYESSLNPKAYYSFFSLVKWLRTNTVIGLFFNFDYGFSYLYNSIEYAKLGNSLSNSLSLIALGSDRYLRGFAVGSCYVAELYYDFSYIGVMFGSFVYGGLMAFFNNIRRLTKGTVWRLAFVLFLFDGFVKSPRWNFDIVLAQFLNTAMWTTIFIVIGLSYLLSMARKRSIKLKVLT